MSTKEKIIVNGMLLGTALLWGSSFSVRKMGLEFMGPFLFNSLRFFAAFIFIGLAYYVQSFINKRNASQQQLETNDANIIKSIWYQIGGGALAGLFYGFGANLQQWGLLTTTAGKVGFITSLYTIFVPVISWIFLKNKIKIKVWAGAVLAFAGLFLISTNGSFYISIGDSVIFISSIFFAIQIIIVGYYAKYSNPILLVTVQLLVGTFVSLLFAILFKEGITYSSIIRGLFPIFYSGVLSLGVANVLQFYAQKKASPSVVAIIISFESVFGLIFSILLLDERMKLLQLFGCLLIFMAVIIIQYEKRSKS